MSALPAEQLLASTLRRSEHAVAVELDGETVVYQSVHQSLTVLDHVGTVVWTLLDGAVPVGTVCSELADAYRAPVDQVRQDVLALVRELAGGELLEHC